MLYWNNIECGQFECILTGDTIQITKLYNSLKPFLIKLTHKNEELIDDIFMKLLKRIGLFDEKRGKFHNFAYTIAKNEFKTLKRKKKKVLDIVYIDNYKDYCFLFDEPEPDLYKKLESLLIKLPPDDLIFINKYICQSPESVELRKKGKNREKFSKLKQLLIEMNKGDKIK